MLKKLTLLASSLAALAAFAFPTKGSGAMDTIEFESDAVHRWTEEIQTHVTVALEAIRAMCIQITERIAKATIPGAHLLREIRNGRTINQEEFDSRFTGSAEITRQLNTRSALA